MPVRKLSVALEDRIARRAAAAAENSGLSLSAWLNHAAETALAVEDGLAAVREWEAEHGALTTEERAQADAVLDGATDRRGGQRRGGARGSERAVRAVR